MHVAEMILKMKCNIEVFIWLAAELWEIKLEMGNEMKHSLV